MQDKSDKNLNFFSRVEHLRKILGLNLSEMCLKIELSRTHLYHLKNGRQIPTAKILGRLETLERANGIFLDGSVEAAAVVRSTEAKYLAGPEAERTAAADHFRDAAKMVDLLREQLAEKDRVIDRLLGIEGLAGRGNTDQTDATD